MVEATCRRGVRGGGRLPAHVPAGPRLRHAVVAARTLFVGAFVGCLWIRAAVYRWVWRNRRLEQLAMLLTRKHPAVGDQLLGIIELVRNDFEQARSRALCEAAVREVAKDAQSRDFSDAVPAPRHKTWAYAAAVPIIAALALGVAFPAAARSAWARLLLAMGRRAAVHLRRARGPALEPGRRARRAVLGDGPAGRGDRLAPEARRGPVRGPANGGCSARGRPL